MATVDTESCCTRDSNESCNTDVPTQATEKPEEHETTPTTRATTTTVATTSIAADEDEHFDVNAHSNAADMAAVADAYDVVDATTITNADTNNITVSVAANDAAHVDAINGNNGQSQNNEMQQEPLSMDDIPEPIKVLDDIISEFEGETTKPAALHSNSGEQQSEDDGYMSLSRKNMSKKDSEDVPQTPSTDTVPEGSFNEADGTLDIGSGTAENLTKLENEPLAEQLIHTTLPKARSVTIIPTGNSNYSSLPCCGARNATNNNNNSNNNSSLSTINITLENKARTSSCNGERNALGIDISAVHNAVLRGNLAKLPEPIVNEHPVTIYPGPSTKPSGDGARSKRHQLINSVEQHKGVCHILNPSSNSSSSTTTTTTTTTSSSSDEASPAASNLNVSKLTAAAKEEEVYSEDSLEESTISTDITPAKQNGIAWEIHFKSNKKKKNKSTCKSAAKKVQTKETKVAEYNSSFSYNQSNMLGKGTFVIRRNIAKKPPRAMDIFNVPKTVKSSAKTEIHSAIYTSDSELSEPALPATAKSVNTVHTASAGDAIFVYKECEAAAAASRRSLEIAAAQRASIASPRERLSLNIEAAHQTYLSKEVNVKPLNNASPEEHFKAFKKVGLNLNEKRLSAESMPDNTSSSEEFDEARLNGNGFDLFPYNPNGHKNQEYEHRTSNTTTPHTDLAPTLEEEDEELSDFSYGCAPLKQIESNISALLRGDMPVARIAGTAVAGNVTTTAAVAAASQSVVSIASELPNAKRPLEFRPGVHKSESAKEMLLSQNAFGPLPPSPPTSNPDLFDYDAPLPPSPVEPHIKATMLAEQDYVKQTQYMKTTTIVEVHAPASSASGISSKHDSTRRSRDNISALRHFNDELPPPPPPPTATAVAAAIAPSSSSSFDGIAPAVPPHRGHSINSMKSWSIDSNYRKRSPKMLGYSNSGITTPTGGGPMAPLPPPPTSAGSYDSGSYQRRYINYGTKRSLKQSPREEHRLQTSCSLPETPIFARGCDIPRTPYRRPTNEQSVVSGSRTAPRSSTSNNINMGNSIMGIGGGTYGTAQMCRQRSINHALASNEMLRMTGAPARGWYPKQRSLRPVSTENIDRLATVRVWDNPAGMSGTGQSRKPLTLPPNLTPSFLNKSPREALRRVTSLLITKKKNGKERKHKAYSEHAATDAGDKHVYEFDIGSTKRKESTRNVSNVSGTNTNTKTKKKSLFKTLWKRTKHVSLDQ